MFAHVVYLMFSSVYVCKETVEHLLLSAGGVQGHHHHHGDEEAASGLGFVLVFSSGGDLLILTDVVLKYRFPSFCHLHNLPFPRRNSLGIQ